MLTATLLAATLALPTLGTNLAPLGPASSAWPFADIVRGSAGWVPQDAGAVVGPGGELVSLAEGSKATLDLFVGSARLRPRGRYLVRWDGKGSLEVEGAEGVQAVAEGIEFQPGDGDVRLLAASKGGEVPGRVQVLAPGHEFAIQGFRRVFLQRSQVYGAIRFAAWQARGEGAAGGFYGKRGVPPGVLAALASSVHAVPCVVLSGDESTEDTRRMAEGWAAALPEGATVIVEAPAADDRWAKAFETWRSALGPGRTLVRCARLGSCSPGLVAELRGRAAPGSLDAVSVPMLFGQAALSAPDEGAAFEAMGGEVDALLENAKLAVREAGRSKWLLLCHEGGLSLPDPPGADDAVRDRLDAIARSKEAGEILGRLLRGWRAAGGSTFFHAADCAPLAAGPRSAALEWIEQDTMASPRRAALTEFALFPDR